MSQLPLMYWYIFGLGKSGKSTMKYCMEQGIPFWVWDDQIASLSTLSPEVIKDPSHVEWDYVKQIVVSPGIPHEGPHAHPVLTEAKKRGISLTVDIEIFLKRAFHHPLYHIIGVTGTNGKSTTVSLITHLLNHAGKKAIAAGNIGTPVLDLPPPTEETYYVLELSSYQLTLLETAVLECAVLLNVTPDHLAYHGSMDRYVAAKIHIFDLVKKGAVCLSGADDAVTQELCDRHPDWIAVSLLFQKCPIYIKGDYLIDNRWGETIHLPFLKNLQGSHNAQNIGASYGVVRTILKQSFSIPSFLEGLETFQSLPHRQEIIPVSGDIVFVNDSKATNMDAAEKSLKVFTKIHWILGGEAKEGETPRSLSSLFSHVHHAYLVGASMAFFAKELDGFLPYTQCDTIQNALQKAYAKAQPGDVILLAPACASFDQFKNFEERGTLFKKWVQELVGERYD